MEAAHLGAAAAALHAAPAPRAVLARVEKHPAADAARARPHALELVRGEELRRRAGEEPQRVFEVALRLGEAPREAAAGRGEAGRGRGSLQDAVQELEVGRVARLARGDRREDAVEGLAEDERLLEG